jgi:HAD superfamily hydrolase (TIGR01509 family)
MPAVVFDFDGLMIDSESEIAACIIEVLRVRRITLAIEEIAHLFGSTDEDAEWERVLAAVGDVTLAELRVEVDAVLPARVDALPLLPGVIEVLDAAQRAGWRTGIATGQERHRLDQHLARFGLRGRFDVIVTRREVPRGKPAPDIYLEVADRLGVAPSECLALEDSLPGYLSARAAGMSVIVCPSPVTAGCAFPPGTRRVGSLIEVELTTRERRSATSGDG